MNMPAVPQPILLNLLLAFTGHVSRKPVNGGFRQLGTSPTIGSRVGGTRPPFQGHQQHHHPGHGRHAGAMFALEQHLRQKSPQGQRGGIDVVVISREGDPLGIKRRLDRLLRQRVGKRQTRPLKK